MPHSALLNIDLLEQELKKRLIYPYHWGRYQNNDWDKNTAYIYKTFFFEDLITQIKVHFNHLKTDTPFVDYFNYALNRWYNFWSASGVEQIFTQLPTVTAHRDQYDKQIDFFIHQIPFDLKTSIYPKSYKKDIDDALKNKKDLAAWLYQNQSKQGRQHFKNRLFLVVYRQDGQHWYLKASLNLIKKSVEKYVDNFMVNNLINLSFKTEKNPTLTDIIFIIQ